MTQLMNLEQLPVKEPEMIQSLVTIENAIINGEADALEIYINVKRGMKFFEMAAKSDIIMDGALSESTKYKGIKYQAFSAGVTETSRSSYNYSDCNDSVLDNLKAELKALNESIAEEATNLSKQIKDRQKMLQGLTQEVANPETGEMMQPAGKNTKRTLVISFK